MQILTPPLSQRAVQVGPPLTSCYSLLIRLTIMPSFPQIFPLPRCNICSPPTSKPQPRPDSSVVEFLLWASPHRVLNCKRSPVQSRIRPSFCWCRRRYRGDVVDGVVGCAGGRCGASGARRVANHDHPCDFRELLRWEIWSKINPLE